MVVDRPRDGVSSCDFPRPESGRDRTLTMKSRRAFYVVAAALAAVVSLGVITTAQNPVLKTWPGADSSNYRPYEQITKANVGQLQMAWSYPYGNGIFSPVYAHDTLYGFGRNGALIALDASTGKE